MLLSFPSSILSSISLPVTNGLYSWYKGENAVAGNKWIDSSGNGRDATTVGAILQTSGTNSKMYIYGGTATSISFPLDSSLVTTSYTLFHRARYNKGVENRIFTANFNLVGGCNYLSGFWNGSSGVAYHEGWLTSDAIDRFGTDWVVRYVRISN